MINQFIKTSFILGGFGTLLILLGMAIPAWMTDSSRDVSAGLYLICGPGGCASVSYQAGGLYASRAFIMIAFFCAIGGMVNGAIYYRRYFIQSIPNRRMSLGSAVLYFISAGCCFAGSIIFVTAGLREMTVYLYLLVGNRFDFTVTYSLGVAIVGALGSAGAGALTLIHLQKEAGPQGTIITHS
ncbi:unnamed protein product [Lymnaea stagnalis]|uniref:Uncharacterized protein n=1 Tax=Lymnaea stagnalis TaxID=6523 RepID=A0AAV2HHW5_LYMST